MAQWKEYFTKITRIKPRALLVHALQYNKKKLNILDLGAGKLVETKYLLKHGHTVTAIDSHKHMLVFAEKIKDKKLTVLRQNIVTYKYPIETYDFVCVLHTLHFLNKKDVVKTLKGVKQTLKPGGLLCITFLGINDSWHGTKTAKTFLTKEEIHKFLEPYTILYFDEEEKNEKTALGKDKHWHIFSVIAQKDKIVKKMR